MNSTEERNQYLREMREKKKKYEKGREIFIKFILAKADGKKSVDVRKGEELLSLCFYAVTSEADTTFLKDPDYGIYGVKVNLID
jgi:hypothetical protein